MFILDASAYASNLHLIAGIVMRNVHGILSVKAFRACQASIDTSMLQPRIFRPGAVMLDSHMANLLNIEQSLDRL
jgi:hypothetical protein